MQVLKHILVELLYIIADRPAHGTIYFHLKYNYYIDLNYLSEFLHECYWRVLFSRKRKFVF